MLLNNDVVVTDGWLDQLIALVNARRGSYRRARRGRREERHRRSGRPSVELGAGSGDPAHNRRWCEAMLAGPPPLTPPSQGGERCWCDQGGLGLTGNEEARGTASPPTARPIGLVGPMSNFVAPPQLVEDVPYRDVTEMHRFARRWRDEHRKQWFTVPKLSGFCLLMKRAVYEKIGGLDERFGLGLFDDDDLAERARRAGFELAVAHDLFVHHFGSRTFLGQWDRYRQVARRECAAVRGEVGAGWGNNGTRLWNTAMEAAGVRQFKRDQAGRGHR